MKHYTEFEKLPTYNFTVSNSIRGCYEPIIDYYETIQEMNNWSVIGYTYNPPFNTHYESVAIMFEHKETFEKRWCHYPLVYFNEDTKPVKINPPKIK